MIRVMQQKHQYDWTNNRWITDSSELYFYGIGVKKVGTYYATIAGTTISWSLQGTQVFFRGKLILRGSQIAQEDIRASVGSYFPYGEDRGSLSNDAVKFASYTRDSVSGMDYADQRYYSS